MPNVVTEGAAEVTLRELNGARAKSASIDFLLDRNFHGVARHHGAELDGGRGITILKSVDKGGYLFGFFGVFGIGELAEGDAAHVEEAVEVARFGSCGEVFQKTRSPFVTKFAHGLQRAHQETSFLLDGGQM